MKKIIILLAVFCSSVSAQTVTIDGAAAMEAVKQQRNQQADIVVELVGRLAALQKELDEAKKKAEACKPNENKDKK